MLILIKLLSCCVFLLLFLYSYFETMFRSFMPEDNTVTVSKIPFIGDKNCFLMTYEFSLNSVFHRTPTLQTRVHNVVISDPLYQPVVWRK